MIFFSGRRRRDRARTTVARDDWCEAHLEVNRLASYLASCWPEEIGRGDPASGESAVDVAIRLLESRAGHGCSR